MQRRRRWCADDSRTSSPSGSAPIRRSIGACRIDGIERVVERHVEDFDAIRRVEPRRDPTALAAVARLTMTLIAAAVRHAITLKPKDAERMIALFEKMLPDNPAALA